MSVGERLDMLASVSGWVDGLSGWLDRCMSGRIAVSRVSLHIASLLLRA